MSDGFNFNIVKTNTAQSENSITQPLEVYSKEVTDVKYVHYTVYETRVQDLEIRINTLEKQHEMEDLDKLIDDKINNAKLAIDNERFTKRLAKMDDRFKWGVTTAIAIIAVVVNVYNVFK